MNYLSFSLWGDNPLYNIGSIRNSELINTIYPNWRMVVYYNNTVPKNTIDQLFENNVLLFDMSHSDMYGMFWRFLAADIDDSNYVCFRDCDSRISIREKLAVDEWINSNKSLHVMRDHPAHQIPCGNDKMGILGGMWGVNSKKINITKMINEYSKHNQHVYGQDQNFLAQVYNYFGDDKITHDDLFEGVPFPIKRENGRFIGERIDINEQPLTNDHTVFL